MNLSTTWAISKPVAVINVMKSLPPLNAPRQRISNNKLPTNSSKAIAKWLPATEPASLEQYKLPEHISLQLELEGLPGEDTNLLSQLDWQTEDDEQPEPDSKIPVLPQVFVLSSGEISPFQLLLSENSDLTPLYSAVSTDFAIPLTRSAVSTERP